MPWMETIDIRSFEVCCPDWIAAMLESIQRAEAADPTVSISLLRNRSLETDVRIQIDHAAGEAEIAGSDLGVKLASACSLRGMVSHNIWRKESLKK